MVSKYFLCLCLVAASATHAVAEESSVEVSVKQLTVALGDTGSVTCTPGGSPLPQVQWKKHGGQFGAGTKQTGNTLIISNAQISDRGYYLCGGIVDRKVVTQQYVLVEVQEVQPPRPQTQPQVRPQPQLTARPQLVPARPQPQTQNVPPRVRVSLRQIKITRGQSGTVDCSPEGYPLPRIQWSKEEGDFNSRVRPSGNSLVLSNVQDGDGGNYICNGLVDATTVWTEYVQVVIAPGREAVPLPYRPAPEQLPKPLDVSVAEGRDIIISCDFKTGDDQQVVSWARLDQRPMPQNVQANGRELIFQRATTDHAAEYLCKVRGGGFLLRQLYLRLDVLALPRVTIRPERPTVTRGEELTLECVAEGNAQVSWERVGEAFSSRVENRSAQLIFRNIEVDDAGSYRCIARNKAGETAQTTQVVVNDYHIPDLEVPQPQIQPPAAPASPRVTVNVRQVKIPRGGSRTVDCSAEGSPLPRVQWSKGEGEFGNGVSQYGNSLTITNAQESDAGDYVCTGIVQATPVWTDYLQVVIEDVPSPPPQPEASPRVTVNARQLKIRRGESGTVDCSPEGSPLPRIQWSKGEGQFGNGVRQDGNSLTITNAQESDAGDYVCTGIVQATPVWTDYLQVVVEDVPPPPPTPQPQASPRVTVNARQLKIRRGESGNVDCSSEGSPLPIIQWSKGDGQFGNGVRQDGNSLTITNAQESDAGDYVCTGIVQATPVWTDYLQVVIEDAPEQPQGSPRVTITEPQVRLPRGGSKKVECVPEGFPLPRVQWTKEEGDFGAGVEIQGNTLIISNAQDSDSGNYVCSGLVQATPVFSDYLQVLVEDVEPATEAPLSQNPPTVKVSESQVRITAGETKTVDCYPEGYPLPTVQWTKEGGQFTSSTRQEGNSLTISEATEDDTGYYICSAIVDNTAVYTDYLTVEVEKKKIDKSICKLAVETSWCYGLRWYYDINEHKCVSYAWGGCGGNANKFDTEEACNLACGGE
ncbi:basement membrane-specific heparan sulfate proteoglycan core protein-like isoform X1 [Leguminivora glycinivorella]|uniref:basement membrane-specific heparan sulfate proteoglycan core protein-like isoform X1 n=1 Tax=Leguminivora glycinivorella TaxID=1035111 RepID=UPI00200D7C65|nr:basement membrane-specific heparan sulfate proteoglycan core protein-like isoform X1 [Leguminivora glycinivorella]